MRLRIAVHRVARPAGPRVEPRRLEPAFGVGRQRQRVLLGMAAQAQLLGRLAGRESQQRRWGLRPAVRVVAARARQRFGRGRLMQPAALRTPLRKAVDAAGIDVDELRVQAAGAAGVKPPEPIKLRRLTWWSVAQVVLLVLAATAVISFATTIDWNTVWSDLISHCFNYV